MGKTWCPAHFCCSQATCQRSLQEVGFVEEKGRVYSAQVLLQTLTQPLYFKGHLYCEDCYGKYLAPNCEKCRKKILGVSRTTLTAGAIVESTLSLETPCSTTVESWRSQKHSFTHFPSQAWLFYCSRCQDSSKSSSELCFLLINVLRKLLLQLLNWCSSWLLHSRWITEKDETLHAILVKTCICTGFFSCWVSRPHFLDYTC